MSLWFGNALKFSENCVLPYYILLLSEMFVFMRSFDGWLDSLSCHVILNIVFLLHQTWFSSIWIIKPLNFLQQYNQEGIFGDTEKTISNACTQSMKFCSSLRTSWMSTWIMLIPLRDFFLNVVVFDIQLLQIYIYIF